MSENNSKESIMNNDEVKYIEELRKKDYNDLTAEEIKFLAMNTPMIDRNLYAYDQEYDNDFKEMLQRHYEGIIERQKKNKIERTKQNLMAAKGMSALENKSNMQIPDELKEDITNRVENRGKFRPFPNTNRVENKGGKRRRNNKRRTNKRRTNRIRTNKRRTNKRRTNKRRSNKRRSNRRSNRRRN